MLFNTLLQMQQPKETTSIVPEASLLLQLQTVRFFFKGVITFIQQGSKKLTKEFSFGYVKQRNFQH